MSIETTGKTENAVELCCWCSIPLGSANTVKERVCIRCYEVLRNAGITEEEIFPIKPDCSCH